MQEVSFLEPLAKILSCKNFPLYGIIQFSSKIIPQQLSTNTGVSQSTVHGLDYGLCDIPQRSPDIIMVHVYLVICYTGMLDPIRIHVCL